jgi:hypothetical protein
MSEEAETTVPLLAVTAVRTRTPRLHQASRKHPAKRNAAKALIAIVACLVVASMLGIVPPGSGAGRTANAQVVTPLSNRFGVCDPHLKFRDAATMDRLLSETSAAGAGWVRMDFAWPDVEWTRDVWNFSLTDLAVQKAGQHGVKILGILGFTPPWANGGNPFFGLPPTDMDAWRTYVSTICTRYKGKVAAWEIWNEENIHSFWLTGPDANAYVQLVAQAAPAIRAADPAATVVMGGVAGLDPNYIDACLKAGIANYVDALAYHPYAVTLPGGLAPQEANCRYIVNWLKWLIPQYTTKHLQIWLTELGWTTSTSWPGVDQSTQASYLSRTFINYADMPVDKIFWYNLWNEHDNAADPESNYGLLMNDFSHKESWASYRAFQGVFNHVMSAVQGVATFSCAAPATLETHCFNLDDGGLLVTAWKSDDAADILALIPNSASYMEPVLIDPVTGQESPATGVNRGADLKITVAGLGIGKRPVLLKFAPMTEPRIASISPAVGTAGTEVTISGAGFGATRGASTVCFGSVAASEYVSWSSDQVKCRVPSQAPGQIQVKVTTAGGASNPATFAIVSTQGPTVVSVTPGAGTEGTTVSVSDLAGTGFASGSDVSISRTGSTIPGASVNVVSSTKISCSFSLPRGSIGTYDMVVRSPNGQEGRLPGGFTVSAQCGTGAAPAMLAGGLVLGLLTVAGLSPFRRRFGRH